MKFIATFIGNSKPSFLVHGKQYLIEIVDNRGKLFCNDSYDFRVIVNDRIGIPYDTMQGIRKNWHF